MLSQALMLLFVGAKFDLLFGFNRTDTGFSTLLYLLVAAPLVSFVWLIAEIIVSIKRAKQRTRAASFLFLGIAFLILLESLVIDVMILSHARM